MKHLRGRRLARLACRATVVAAVAGLPVHAFAGEHAARPRSEKIDNRGNVHGNWRTRALLEQQREATGGSAPMSGGETDIILEHYDKSIGKGGAGAELPPRNDEPSQGMSQ